MKRIVFSNFVSRGFFNFSLLNRLLGVTVVLQQRLFDCFMNNFEAAVQHDMATGQYDGTSSS